MFLSTLLSTKKVAQFTRKVRSYWAIAQRRVLVYVVHVSPVWFVCVQTHRAAPFNGWVVGRKLIRVPW